MSKQKKLLITAAILTILLAGRIFYQYVTPSGGLWAGIGKEISSQYNALDRWAMTQNVHDAFWRDRLPAAIWIGGTLALFTFALIGSIFRRARRRLKYWRSKGVVW